MAHRPFRLRGPRVFVLPALLRPRSLGEWPEVAALVDVNGQLVAAGFECGVRIRICDRNRHQGSTDRDDGERPSEDDSPSVAYRGAG